MYKNPIILQIKRICGETNYESFFAGDKTVGYSNPLHFLNPKIYMDRLTKLSKEIYNYTKKNMKLILNLKIA